MADVASSLKDWSTTAASNSPTDATTVGAGLADNLQEIQKVVRQDLAHKGADIASAGTTDLGAVAGSYHDITGTTTITAFGTVSAGISKDLQFDGAVTLTHNSTSLILPGGANITTAAGDHLRAMSLGSGNWVVTNYARATGAAVRAADTTRNALDNGDFLIWQRGTSIGSASTYTADRWRTSIGATGVATITRGSSVPTVAQAGRVVPYSYSLDVTTADATIGAADVAHVYQMIEGSRWATIAQQPTTVSFWVRSTVTGTYCVTLGNFSDRMFVRTYTISASDTWEFKTVSFDASPSAGTWSYTAGTVGAYLSFIVAAGTNYHTTAGSWISGNANAWATSAQANGLSSTANFFMLAGVQLERGVGATPFDAVPFDNELRRCQRFYSKSFPYATAPAQNVGSNLGALTWINILGGANNGSSQSVQFPERMATTATVTLYNPAAANAQIRNLSTSADWSSTSAQNSSDTGFYAFGTQDAGAAAGAHTHAVHWAASAEL